MIEERQAVAHPPVGALGDEAEGVLIGGQALRNDDVAQAQGDGLRANAPEVEALQAGQDRGGALGDLLRLRRREHEHHAGRRLLEDLEERVPRLAREHVRLVDDVHLVAGFRARGVHGALAQVAGVVHAAVRRGVQLDDVQIH